MPQYSAPGSHIDRLEIVHEHHQVRDAGIGKAHSPFSGDKRDSSLRPEPLNRLQVHLWLAIAESGRNHPNVGRKAKSVLRTDPKFCGQPSCAERRIAAELAKAPITVEVTDPKYFCGIVLQKNNTIRTYTSRPGADSVNNGRICQFADRHLAGVKKEKVIPRPAHLPKLAAMRNAHSRPTIAHHRSRGTMRIASRTIPLLILLVPCVRSLKTIGISTHLNPFRDARKLISI